MYLDKMDRRNGRNAYDSEKCLVPWRQGNLLAAVLALTASLREAAGRWEAKLALTSPGDLVRRTIEDRIVTAGTWLEYLWVLGYDCQRQPDVVRHLTQEDWRLFCTPDYLHSFLVQQDFSPANPVRVWHAHRGWTYRYGGNELAAHVNNLLPLLAGRAEAEADATSLPEEREQAVRKLQDFQFLFRVYSSQPDDIFELTAPQVAYLGLVPEIPV